MDPFRRFAPKFKLVLHVAFVLAMVPAIHPIRATLNVADRSNRTQTCYHFTGLGEHQRVILPDGSKVDLNTNSWIRCAFSPERRNVEVSGEALFTVNSVDRRPFQVLGRQLIVKDLSTSFVVFTKEDSTLVTVTGGRVRVAAPIGGEARAKFRQAGVEDVPWQRTPEIHRGQQAEFFENATLLRQYPDLDEPRLRQLLAWTEGRIDLNGRTLIEALTEFSRYQPISHFKLEDRKLRELRVGGNVQFANLKDFLAALKVEFHVESKIDTDSDGMTVVTLSRGK